MPRARKGAADPTPLAGQRQPITTVPDQPYGEATRQRMAMRAVPMATQPNEAPPGTQPPPATGPGVAAPSTPARSATPAPGSLPWLHPTNRPDEPVTEGMPFGPGNGPEAYTPIAPPSMSSQLMNIAQARGNETLAGIAASAQAMGL